MAVDWELLLEAERRGILPDDKKALLAEARGRGLVPSTSSGSGTASDPFMSESQVVVTPQGSRVERREPGAMEYLWNRAKKGFAGFMGAPGDVVDAVRNLPVNRLTLSNPITGMAALGNAAGRQVLPPERLPTREFIAGSAGYRDVMGVDPNMTTESPGLRYVGGVAEMAAAGGPMMLARGAALPIASSSVGAGLGMEAGGDAASGLGLNRQAGEAVGSLVGGFVPAAASMVGKGAATSLIDRFRPSAQRAKAEGAVAREIGINLESYPAAQQNLERSLEVGREMGKHGASFTPSLPARIGAPGLLAAEKQLTMNNPETLNRAVQNIERNEAEIQKFVNTTIPATGGPTVVQRVASLQRQSAAKLDAMRRAVDDKLDEVAQVVERNPNNYAAGQRVPDLVIQQKTAYRAAANQRYQEVYREAEKLGVRDNVDDLVDFTHGVLRAELNAYQQSEIPAIFREVSRRFPESAGRQRPNGVYYQREAPNEVSFEELHSLYKRVNADIASTAASTTLDKDFKLLLLNQTKDMLTAKIAKFEQAGFGPVAEKLREANRFYREEYLPRFKQGFGGDVMQKYNTGEFRVPNEKVVEMITRGNNAQAAKDFKLLFDDVPEAWVSLRDGYMDALYRVGNVIGADGKISQRAIDGFLRKHSQTLSEFPQVRSEFQRLAADNSALLARRAQITEQEKALASSEVFKLFQGKPVAEVMTEAMTNPNVMRVLSHHARNNPAQANGLARAIAEHVIAQPDPAAFLAKNRETIAAGLNQLGKDHVKNVETAVEALTINRRNDLPVVVKAQSVTPDPILGGVGSSPRAMIASAMSVARGRTGVRQEAAFILGRWFDKLRRDHKAVAMEAVFYDPNAARAIANLAKNPESARFRLDWVNTMAGLGIRAEVAGQE